jgi:hypothetical protein
LPYRRHGARDAAEATNMVSSESWLAYCGYLLWLMAGLGDFVRHRRTDLPHTSGVAESVSHLVQLALLALAIVIGLAFQMGRAVGLLLLVLVVMHAAVGYWDTRTAFERRRVITPLEQHIHSVLDMAPWIALAWLLATTWPAAASDGWQISPRRPALPFAIWSAVLAPAAALSVVPALLEFNAAWKARREPRAIPQR